MGDGCSTDVVQPKRVFSTLSTESRDAHDSAVSQDVLQVYCISEAGPLDGCHVSPQPRHANNSCFSHTATTENCKTPPGLKKVKNSRFFSLFDTLED